MQSSKSSPMIQKIYCFHLQSQGVKQATSKAQMNRVRHMCLTQLVRSSTLKMELHPRRQYSSQSPLRTSNFNVSLSLNYSTKGVTKTTTIITTLERIMSGKYATYPFMIIRHNVNKFCRNNVDIINYLNCNETQFLQCFKSGWLPSAT
jgi:hypothetical protein